MASTGKKGKKNKGKTVPLNDFLSNTISWSDDVDEGDTIREIRRPELPAAPRAARALEFDESRISKSPPYVAYLSNLSYELQESDIINAFKDLSISIVRLPRDERNGRLKGFGYVEFNDRGSFISALQKYEATIKGRRIRIDVAENNEGERRRGGMRDNRDRESNYDSERSSSDWRVRPRSEFSSNDDRRGPMSGRKDYGSFRDRDGFDKNRGGSSGGERESSWRDNERRFGSERDSRNNYGSRRNYDEPESNVEQKTRPKLNLKPRTLPVEEIVVKDEDSSRKEEDNVESEKPEKPERPEKSSGVSAASIFGQAKPVDTAAREREIEQRLEKEREGARNEKGYEKSKPREENEENSISEGKRLEPAPEPKENVWVRRSQRPEAQNVTAEEPANGKTDDLDEPPAHSERERETTENSEDSDRRYGDNRRNDDYEIERDADSRYSRYNRNDNRYIDRNRENDRPMYRRDDKYRDDKDRRDRDRRDYDRRDRGGYDSDRRGGNSGGRIRDQDRDGDSRRYNDRDAGDHKRFNNDREGDWKYSDKDGDNKRFQDRDGGRYKDDHGNNKGPRGGDRRSGPPSADKGSRLGKGPQERERGPQNKDRSRDQKKPEDGLRMPKLREAAAPNYIGTNKYSFLEEDRVSE